MRVTPPRKYAAEFYDVDPDVLALPGGVAGVKLATWWARATPLEQRDYLHDKLASLSDNDDVAVVGSNDSDSTDGYAEIAVCEEDDDDYSDVLFAERHDCDCDEYEEDYP